MTIPIYLSDTPNLDADDNAPCFDDGTYCNVHGPNAPNLGAQPDAAPDELAQDGQPESYMSIALRVRELEARPCPHVVTGAEGTQYCSLAEESVKRLEAQLAEARTECDTYAKSALEVFSSCFCDTHGEQIKRISFSAFCEWTKEMGCHACAFERAEKAEAQLAEARNAKRITEDLQLATAAELDELTAQLASARVELGNKNGALGLREHMIQVLREQIDEAEKSNAAHAGKLTETIEMICERQSRLREALEAVEWIGAQGMKCCPWCHSWKMDGHKPDCARQLALNPRGEGADVAAR